MPFAKVLQNPTARHKLSLPSCLFLNSSPLLFLTLPVPVPAPLLPSSLFSTLALDCMLRLVLEAPRKLLFSRPAADETARLLNNLVEFRSGDLSLQSESTPFWLHKLSSVSQSAWNFLSRKFYCDCTLLLPNTFCSSSAWPNEGNFYLWRYLLKYPEQATVPVLCDATDSDRGVFSNCRCEASDELIWVADSSLLPSY
jgi:hypothetical protein